MNIRRKEPIPASDIAVVANPDDAIRLAESCPHLRVEVFPRSWASVDRARADVVTRHLEDRVSVHHRAAVPAVWNRPSAKR